MDYQFTTRAFRQLQKLPPPVQKRILEKLDFYCRQKEPLRFADRLTDFRLGTYRFRIGEYRVICDLEDEETLLVLLVGHRKEIYR